MGFVKVVKNNAYFKRYQTKYRRRREYKTDYFARRRMVIQDKNKYDTKKYRFVVRRTNSKVVCQVVCSTIKGDKIMCQALSTELSKFGLEKGLTNYSASYCTGLLCARRLLKNLKMDTLYNGITESDGKVYDVYEAGHVKDRKPFKAYLDVGIVRTTTGNRAFAAMKGACDGGLYIPHNNKRFPGHSKDAEGKEHFEADVHRQHIYGAHVEEYMDKLEADNAEKCKSQFGKWNAFFEKTKCETLEQLYKKVHAAIRKDPTFKAKATKKSTPRKWEDKNKTVMKTAKGKYRQDRKITREQRQKNVANKIKAAMSKAK
jgi:large subunit ribosomal protein L5e